MTTLTALYANSPIRLADADVPAFLATTACPVLIDVAAEWCPPCQLLRPIIHKLAAEFAGAIVVVELDGDTADAFKQTYDVDCFPHLLFFKSGSLVQRKIGYDGADAIRETVAKFLGVAIDGEPSAAELAFRDACAQANARREEIIAPARQALEPHLGATKPETEALETNLAQELEAGRINEAEAEQLREDGYNRIYAPFQGEIEVFQKAQRMLLRPISP